MQVVVATHGYCFDGLVSATLFTHLLRALEGPELELTYRGCGYGVAQARPEGKLLGAENAVLDYRFTRDPSLTWYFDHHATAFPAEGDRAAFDVLAARARAHYDSESPSCAGLIARVAVRDHGVELGHLAELVEWADRVDSARFDDAEHAISREDPIKRLVSVVEHHANDAFLARLVPTLLTRPLAEVAQQAFVRDRYRPIGARHDEFVRRVRASARRIGRVVLVDLSSAVVAGVEKFVTYALYPDAVYSVLLARRRHDVAITVGYNPWSGQDRDLDISRICARHGGGGHPVVGAISFELGRLEAARGVAEDIARELAG